MISMIIQQKHWLTNNFNDYKHILKIISRKNQKDVLLLTLFFTVLVQIRKLPHFYDRISGEDR